MRWEDYWSLEGRVEGSRVGVPMEAIVITGQRQLFVDNYVIEHMDNLGKSLHRPTRHPLNPLIRPDRPWERYIGYATLFHDADMGCFRAWYMTHSGLAHATSDDGLHWAKPTYGQVERDGSTANNLIHDWIESPVIIQDPYDADPARRYKMLFWQSNPYGLHVGWSPDGLRWTARAAPVLTAANDAGLNDHPTMMLDTAKRRYIAFPKREMFNPFANGDWGGIQRMRCVSLSHDFETWSDPVLTLRADDADPRDLQMHGLAGFNYEGMYIGIVEAMHSGDVGPYERTIDLQLACSRDGETWWRAGNRQTFLPLGAEGEWDQFMLFPIYAPPVRQDDTLWLYYTGFARRHRRGEYPAHRQREPWRGPGHPEPHPEGREWPPEPVSRLGQPTSGLGLAELRVDGFVSVDAGPRPGRLLTKPLLFSEGGELRVNADARGGHIRAELFIAEPVDLRPQRWTNSPAWNWQIGEPVAGYTLADAVPLTGDTTDGLIRWQGGADLSRFTNRPVVIRFQMSNAALYSFWIA